MDELTVASEVGQAIRRRRQLLGLTQEAFADQIAMHRAYYGSIERGSRNITLDTLVKVCAGLRAKPSTVLGESGL